MVLQAFGLTKRYPMGVRALDGVSVKVRPGEFVAVMGRSGSGKSTLLHLLGCLDRPCAGSIWLDGNNVTAMPDRDLARLRRERLGFVFQAHNLMHGLTALENVALPLRYLRPRLRWGEALRRAKAALEAVGLGDRIDHLPGQLSGGQQQRVAIARAIINRPAVVLADEPTGALDSTTASSVLALLRQLGREQGQACLIVTHDPAVAAVCDRSITLIDGRVCG